MTTTTPDRPPGRPLPPPRRTRRAWIAGTLRLAAACLPALGVLPVHAQTATLPARPLRVVVPFAAGGAVDTVARIVGERLALQIGQPVVVENKPGDNANIGANEVVRAEADGATLLLGANGLATNPSLTKRLPFDPLVDLVTVARVGFAPLVLVVPAGSPPKTVADLVVIAKQKKGAMNYGSSAIGGSGHLAGELFKRSAGIEAVHVAYKGGAPALTDLIGGRLDFMMINPLEAAPHVATGRLRALAVATQRRIDTLPDTPTFAQAGVAGFDATVWWGYMAPAKTPRPIVERLSAEILKALDDPEVQQKLRRIGAIVEPMPADRFDGFLRSETRRWADIIRTAGITYE